MRQIKTFFVSIMLIAITFAMVLITSLVYRANEQKSIKSYIFQMNNLANQRVGFLQNINNMSAIELRNKLIQKYVSEYFKVIPGTRNVSDNPMLEQMSRMFPDAYKQWQNGEAQNIEKMASENKFRIAGVSSIIPVNKPERYDYYDEVSAKPIYYEVRYETTTWNQSNKMWVEPVNEQGVIYIEAIFIPGLRKEVDVKRYLEEGKNPAELFRFQVRNVSDKVNR